MKKWHKVLSTLADSRVLSAIHTMNGIADTERPLLDALRAGETEFVAAGGDGTVNYMLNLLLDNATPQERTRLALGGIGLGSSNDFYKPVTPSISVPTRINFESARPRDVGKITFEVNGIPRTRYFLTNASAGVTASANYLFNNPDTVLKALKALSTPAAIMYAAMKTIGRHRNIEAQVQMPYSGPCNVNLTNLAILKNPNVSGNFRFPVEAYYDDGRFTVCLFHNMNRRDLLHALNHLRGKGRMEEKKAVIWLADLLTVNAAQPFAVEFDGEVVSTTSARFEVLPRFLKVCTC